MTGDCLCLMLGIDCWCTRPGPGGFGYRPHGTLAAVRRHYRRETPLCRPCEQAAARDAADRKAQHDRRRRERRYEEWQARNPAGTPAEFGAWWQAQRHKTGAITKAAAAGWAEAGDRRAA